jgi:thiol-disulfide isomerase/thioredoxin
MLYYVLYAISISLVWHFLLYDIGYIGFTGVFLGMIFTFYSTYLVKTLVEKEISRYTFIKFLLPVAFLIITIYQIPYDSIFTLLNPVIIAFIIFLSANFDKRKFPKFEVQFFLIFFVYFYSFSLTSSLWQYYISVAERKKYNFSLREDKALTEENNLNLNHYSFLNQSLDTVKIETKEKYIVIETWNEKCPPCMKAIPEMSSFYLNIKSKVTNYYVYIPVVKIEELNTQKVFNFDKIKEKNKILVDVNLQKDTELEEYPVFFVFDKDGNRRLLYKGYIKEELQQKITEVIK